MGVHAMVTQRTIHVWIAVLVFCIVLCEAQRVSYIIGQNVLGTSNRTSNFIVSLATEEEKAESFSEFVESGNSTFSLPVRNQMYCKTNHSTICNCTLDSYVKYVSGNTSEDDKLFSTIWKLSKDVSYKLKPMNFTQNFIKMKIDETNCLSRSITIDIEFCLVDATMADVQLASHNDNFTIFDSDRTFRERNVCEVPRRRPVSYLCVCEKSCHMFAAYNLTDGGNRNTSQLDKMIDSRGKRGNIYIVFPRQFIGRPTTCDSKGNTDISGFLLDATSLKTVDFVLSILSLLTLFLTIFFFATCPELRNLHGKNLMSLSVTIFFSQILFLHDVGTLNDKLCSGIGALLHFCYLSIFVWTSSMAFDLARTFSVKSAINQRHATNDQRRYRKYALVAWGCPALLVLICVIINSDLHDSIQLYGTIVDGGVCMAANQVMIYGLFLPFCLSIMFNIICFVIIVHGIETNKSKRSRNTQNLEKTRCFIYGKISTLLGLSWIICLVATIKASRTFWFSFSIMSNLQGISIFVSFILLNRRVRGVVKRQLTNQDGIDSQIACVQNAYECLERDRIAFCQSDVTIERENKKRDAADFNYENPIYSPDEME